MLHSLWQYIESLQPWKQFGILVAFLLSLGFSFREIVSFITRMYREWRERRTDDEVVGYLLTERENTKPEYDSYGQPKYSYYRSAIEVATAVHRSSVDVYRRLCRLQEAQRIDRLAPKADAWTITNLELHDANRRRRRWFGKRK